MTLKELKKWVNTLTEKELNQELVFYSEDYSMSGVIDDIEKNKVDLYYTGEDDPAPLYTEKELLEDGYTKEDIKGFDLEIVKGEYYLKF